MNSNGRGLSLLPNSVRALVRPAVCSLLPKRRGHIIANVLAAGAVQAAGASQSSSSTSQHALVDPAMHVEAVPPRSESTQPRNQRKQYRKQGRKGGKKLQSQEITLSDESIAAIQRALRDLPPSNARNAQNNGEVPQQGTNYASPAASILKSRGSPRQAKRTQKTDSSSGVAKATLSYVPYEKAEGAQDSFERPQSRRLALELPDGEFEELEDGRVRCLPCRKDCAGISAYARHLLESARHGGIKGLRASRAVPPALMRSASPPPVIGSPEVPITQPTPPTSLSTLSAAASRSSASQSSASVRFEKRCSSCEISYTNTAALHRHLALDPAHPHYCPDCTTEYQNADVFRAHYEQNSICHYRGEGFPQQPPSSAVLGPSRPSAMPGNGLCAQVPPTEQKIRPPIVTQRPRQGQHQNPTHKGNFPLCLLCSRPLVEAGEVSTTFCGHLFCFSCIMDHLAENQDCPYCHKLMTVQMLIPLYF